MLLIEYVSESVELDSSVEPRVQVMLRPLKSTLLERAQERDMLDPSSISTVPLGLSVGGPSTA